MGETLYAVGKVVRVRGIKGEVVVEPLTNFVDRFRNLKRVFLNEDASRSLDVRGVRFFNQRVLLTFGEINSRSEAEKLIGTELSVPESELIELPQDTFFQFEIVGMSVYTEDNRRLGEITEIISMPAQDLWQVKGNKDFLLPATQNVIVKIDRKQKRVTVRLIEGLLDL